MFFLNGKRLFFFGVLAAAGDGRQRASVLHFVRGDAAAAAAAGEHPRLGLHETDAGAARRHPVDPPPSRRHGLRPDRLRQNGTALEVGRTSVC